MKHYLTKKFKNISNNSKGFSLVELVVSIGILAALSVILMHAFVTSNTVTNKARKIGEATDAAQNIQEVLQSIGFDSFISSGNLGNDSSPIVQKLTVTKGETQFVPSITSVVDNETDESVNNNEKTVQINGIKSGSSLFDAKITFSSGTLKDNSIESDETVEIPDGFSSINTKEISNFSVPDGSFVQPYNTSDNPDMLADEKLPNDVDKITAKQRVIKIDITGVLNTQDDTYSGVSVKTVWNYDYKYQIKSKDDDENYFGTNNNASSVCSVNSVINEDIIIDGTCTAEDPLLVYVMYYPCYNDEEIRRIGSSNNNYLDRIEINNPSDIPVQITLIKQKPAVYIEEIDKYINLIDGSDIYQNNGGSLQLTDTAKSHYIKGNLAYYESLYQVEINEVHSGQYIKKIKDDLSVVSKTFMTNAGTNLYYLENGSSSNVKIGSLSYVQTSTEIANNTIIQKQASEIVTDGSLVDRENIDRIYAVTIELYESGGIEAGDEAYATFSTSVLK